MKARDVGQIFILVFAVLCLIVGLAQVILTIFNPSGLAHLQCDLTGASEVFVKNIFGAISRYSCGG